MNDTYVDHTGFFLGWNLYTQVAHKGAKTEGERPTKLRETVVRTTDGIEGEHRQDRRELHLIKILREKKIKKRIVDLTVG